MGKPAARVGDQHTCPAYCGPVPHIGGPVMVGIPTALIANMPAATLGSTATCTCATDVVIQGSPTVLVGGKPLARMGDAMAHGGKLVVGSPTVLVG